MPYGAAGVLGLLIFEASVSISLSLNLSLVTCKPFVYVQLFCVVAVSSNNPRVVDTSPVLLLGPLDIPANLHKPGETQYSMA